MLLKAFPIPNNFLKMQLSERSQVKSKVNKEWVRLLTMTGNFPIIGKAKCSQGIVTLLHRVA